MFKRKNRLSLSSPISFSHSLSTPALLFKYKPNDLPYNRYAFIISKKIEKTAAGRNRIKRLLSSYLQAKDAKLLKGYDMLFVVRKGDSGLLEEAILELLTKAKLV